MKDDTIYILNPIYDIKRDRNRPVLFYRDANSKNENFIGIIHPVYAIIFSFFDGSNRLADVIETASSVLRIELSVMRNLISKMIGNDDVLHFDYDGSHFVLPKDVLVERTPEHTVSKYNPRDFFIPKNELDVSKWRLNSPLDAVFMINTLCYTDCIYCYADRSKRIDCKIPFERLKELIAEAKNLGMRSIDFTGGELFKYRHWQQLLAELVNNGFNPYLSTKCPLDRETVARLKDTGLTRIQISIDSIVKEELVRMLNVKEDYYDRLLETFKLLDDSGFDIFTNTQLTSINMDNIKELVDFLLALKNIKRINIGAASFSLYKGEKNFLEYKPSLERLKEIENYVNDCKDKYADRVELNFSGYLEGDKTVGVEEGEKRKNFYERANCSGNFYAFVILPDGQVTICEELYWHPAFIIGDLKKQSIEEVWNSKRALELYNLSRDSVQAESPCKSCGEFDDCHKFKGVCWKEILYAYGFENWDYPDPKCPYAGMPKRQYYL